MADKPIEMPAMCETHQALLVHQVGVPESGPWRSLIIVANVVLFQMVSTDQNVYDRVGGDAHRLKELGCLACLHPDYFGEVVQAAQSSDMQAMKKLGERYVFNSQIKRNG